MTVSWKDAQDSIKAGIASLGAVVTGATVWSDDPRPAAKTLLILDPVSFASLQDREEYVESAVPGIWTWQLSSLYYIRIQVRAESVYTVSGSDAMFALEKVRAGLKRPTLLFGAGVVNQPDNTTYVHHVPYSHDGHVISSYSFETGFRAVLDFPLTGTIPAAPNMTSVILLATEIDVGEVTIPNIDQTIDRV